MQIPTYGTQLYTFGGGGGATSFLGGIGGSFLFLTDGLFG